MSHYHHLSIKERECIWENKILGKSLREISAILGRSAATISRELQRNRQESEYRPSAAQKQYQERRERCRRKKLLSDAKLRDPVVRLLSEKQWSPEQISQRLAYEGKPSVSYNTIYRAIKTGIMEPHGSYKNAYGRYPLSRYLRRKGWKGKKKNNRTTQHFVHQTIDERPRAAETKSQFGHLEGDLVYNKANQHYIITLADRRSKYLLTGICRSRRPEEVAEVMCELLRSAPWARTVTLDRGTEFAEHSKITEKLPHIQFYFAHPHAPWERGLNENTNGLLRQYVPKYSRKAPFSPELLREFTDKLNTRPRKTLAWKSPAEVLFHKSLHLT